MTNEQTTNRPALMNCVNIRGNIVCIHWVQDYDVLCRAFALVFWGDITRTISMTDVIRRHLLKAGSEDGDQVLTFDEVTIDLLGLAVTIRYRESSGNVWDYEAVIHTENLVENNYGYGSVVDVVMDHAITIVDSHDALAIVIDRLKPTILWDITDYTPVGQQRCYAMLQNVCYVLDRKSIDTTHLSNLMTTRYGCHNIEAVYDFFVKLDNYLPSRVLMTYRYIRK